MSIKITVEINPHDEVRCGIKCKWLETYCGCRFYCCLLGNKELNINDSGDVLRHPDCIKAEQEAMK